MQWEVIGEVKAQGEWDAMKKFKEQKNENRYNK